MIGILVTISVALFMFYFYSHVGCARPSAFGWEPGHLDFAMACAINCRRSSAFGRGPGSAEFLQWCWCTGICMVKFAALCVGIFYGVFLCPHSFSVFTVSGNAPFGLLIILHVARL